MTKKIAALICAIVALAITAAWLISQKPASSPIIKNQAAKKTHFAYFMQKDFYSGIENGDPAAPLNEKVFGGIVSHHFYVEKEITKFFSLLALQNPKTIVVIGPNHFNAGNAELQTSFYPYETPWGRLDPDLELIAKLMALAPIKNEEGAFEREHSISTEVGFIKHQFPNAAFIPIIVKRNTPKEKIQQLAEALNAVLPQDSLVIASVDFSHHVDNKTAQENDRQSIAFMQNFDYVQLAKRTPTQMDSPPSIITLLKYLELRGGKKMSYTNTNQALVSGNLKNTDVTSYVFAEFTQN